MADFKSGDRVAALDEDFEGVVHKVTGDTVTVEDKEGFRLDFLRKELIKLGKSEIELSAYQAEQLRIQEESNRKSKSVRVPPKQRNAPKMSVDLHIEKLVPSTKGMDNYDILELQLRTAKQQLDFAIGKRIQKVVFIHGVGEGVLKTELYALFRRYDDVKFYDADYRQYGYGATEVYIPQNQ